MGGKEKIWLLIGVLLLVSGVLSYLSQQQELKKQDPTVAVPETSGLSRTTEGSRKFDTASSGESDTGFEVDPVRGVVRKNDGIKYFQ